MKSNITSVQKLLFSTFFFYRFVSTYLSRKNQNHFLFLYKDVSYLFNLDHQPKLPA